VGSSAATKKKLVFALRDFDTTNNNLENIKANLSKDMNEILDKIETES
jgi:hypothetical protein